MDGGRSASSSSRCVARKCRRLARGGAEKNDDESLDDDETRRRRRGKERARTEEASRVAVRAGDVLGLWCRTTTRTTTRRTFFATIEEELFLCETAWKVPTSVCNFTKRWYASASSAAREKETKTRHWDEKSAGTAKTEREHQSLPASESGRR